MVAICFSTEEDSVVFAVNAVDAAEHEILVNAYGLTTGSGIVEALAQAQHQGVHVKLIGDRTTPCERGSGIDALV